MGSDGKRHWVDYKYERLSLFCHFSGVLGHDVRHCPAHFEVSKKATTIEYQYGEWLKAYSERNTHSVGVMLVRLVRNGLTRKTTTRWRAMGWKQR